MIIVNDVKHGKWKSLSLQIYSCYNYLTNFSTCAKSAQPIVRFSWSSWWCSTAFDGRQDQLRWSVRPWRGWAGFRPGPWPRSTSACCRRSTFRTACQHIFRCLKTNTKVFFLNNIAPCLLKLCFREICYIILHKLPLSTNTPNLKLEIQNRSLLFLIIWNYFFPEGF